MPAELSTSRGSEERASMSLRLAGHTFGYLHHRTLAEALVDLAQAGFAELELTPMPPHLHTPGFGAYERRALVRRLRAADMRCRHALAPAPADDARAVLLDGLARLLAAAESRGVTLVLENSPYGFLGRAEDLLGIAQELAHPRLRLCYDVANALAQEDPADGVRRLAGWLGLAHVSDTRRDSWAHTSIGTGDVDFGAFATALDDVGYADVVVYELVDGQDPGPRLQRDLRSLAAHGFAAPRATAAEATT
jgi:sugar phosphate isomerase/epimerase